MLGRNTLLAAVLEYILEIAEPIARKQSCDPIRSRVRIPGPRSPKNHTLADLETMPLFVHQRDGAVFDGSEPSRPAFARPGDVVILVTGQSAGGAFARLVDGAIGLGLLTTEVSLRAFFGMSTWPASRFAPLTVVELVSLPATRRISAAWSGCSLPRSLRMFSEQCFIAGVSRDRAVVESGGNNRASRPRPSDPTVLG